MACPRRAAAWIWERRFYLQTGIDLLTHAHVATLREHGTPKFKIDEALAVGVEPRAPGGDLFGGKAVFADNFVGGRTIGAGKRDGHTETAIFGKLEGNFHLA